MKTEYLRLSEHNFQLIFQVLRALQTDDLSLYRLASSCMFDIMHTINKTHISIIIFWHKPKVFVEINDPLSVNFNNKFFHFLSSNTNTIHVISEKIKNYTGDCEKHSVISIIGQYLKSIPFTKLDNKITE